jgi:hypothetical protein
MTKEKKSSVGHELERMKAVRSRSNGRAGQASLKRPKRTDDGGKSLVDHSLHRHVCDTLKGSWRKEKGDCRPVSSSRREKNDRWMKGFLYLELVVDDELRDQLNEAEP